MRSVQSMSLKRYLPVYTVYTVYTVLCQENSTQYYDPAPSHAPSNLFSVSLLKRGCVLVSFCPPEGFEGILPGIRTQLVRVHRTFGCPVPVCQLHAHSSVRYRVTGRKHDALDDNFFQLIKQHDIQENCPNWSAGRRNRWLVVGRSSSELLAPPIVSARRHLCRSRWNAVPLNLTGRSCAHCSQSLIDWLTGFVSWVKFIEFTLYLMCR